MTVLQSVCSHGHKLQFRDVQQGFTTGDPIKREQPLFVRMPPDGVPGEPRDFWVQLLKTVNGLADGTKEWRNCFLATARGRPDLSGPVSILQSRFNRAQVSDIQETNRVVRLAKAHTDLALPVCGIPVDQICLVSYGDASGGGIHAEQAQAGYVIMFADMSLLAGLAAPVTLVSWRSHHVKRVVASASAAEPWVCLRRLHRVAGYVHSGAKWCWGRVCANGEHEKACHHSYRSRIRRAITTTYTTKQSAPVRTGESAIDLAIIREDLSRPKMFLRWVDGKAQVADALTKLHGDGDLLRAVCRRCWSKPPEILAARRQERRERENVPRVKSPFKLREPVDETSIPVTLTPTVA